MNPNIISNQPSIFRSTIPNSTNTNQCKESLVKDTPIMNQFTSTTSSGENFIGNQSAAREANSNLISIKFPITGKFLYCENFLNLFTKQCFAQKSSSVKNKC